MTVLIQGDQIRAILFGVRVTKGATTVPETGTLTPLFTVSGGRVLVTSLTGEVTTVIGGTTPTLTLVFNPTSGTDTNLCTATTVTDDAVGTLWSLPGLIGSALNVSSGVGAVSGMSQPVVVDVGTIDVTSGAANTTGAASWVLTYVPLDTGASVVAA